MNMCCNPRQKQTPETSSHFEGYVSIIDGRKRLHRTGTNEILGEEVQIISLLSKNIYLIHRKQWLWQNVYLPVHELHLPHHSQLQQQYKSVQSVPPLDVPV